MTEDEVQTIVDNAHRRFAAEHADVVVWARLQIKKEQQREERWEKLQATLIGQAIMWTLGTLIVGTGTIVYQAMVQWIRGLQQ